MNRVGRRFCFVAVAFAATLCSAGTVTVSGFMNDTGNTALIGSDAWSDATTPPTAQFASDNDIANNIALYSFNYSSPTVVTFTSLGFANGGLDPYFSLFAGNDGTATFVGSNFDQAFSTGGDFSLSFVLSPGTYTVALGTFANMSFAENLGSGELGDGFIGLGEPSSLGDSHYELEVSTSGVPEPATLALLLSGLAASSWWRRRLGCSSLGFRS